MAVQLQLRSGTTEQHNTFTGAVGEVTVDTTNKTLRVHDGTTAGGTRLVTLTGGLIPAAQLPSATTSVQGAVILNNTLTSTSTTQALTAAQGKVLKDTLDNTVASLFGVGQTYQDVLASRSKGVTYTNTTGRPIGVVIKVEYADDDGDLTVTVGGVGIGRVKGNAPGGSGYWQTTLSFTVPNLTTYAVSGGSGVFGWAELR